MAEFFLAVGDFDRSAFMSSTRSMVDEDEVVDEAATFGPLFDPAPFLIAFSIEMERLTGEFAARFD